MGICDATENWSISRPQNPKSFYTSGGEDTEYIEPNPQEFPHVLAQCIADMGNNGWELFQTDNVHYYFKRQIVDV